MERPSQLTLRSRQIPHPLASAGTATGHLELYCDGVGLFLARGTNNAQLTEPAERITRLSRRFLNHQAKHSRQYHDRSFHAQVVVKRTADYDIIGVIVVA